MPRHATKTSFKKGYTPWNKGIPRKLWNPALETEEAKEKIRQVGLSNKGKKRPYLSERNKLMKGKSKPGKEFHKGATCYRRYAKENLPQKCDICDTTEQLVVHHINTDHFDNSSTNLQLLCRSCHMKLHQKQIGVAENS